MWTFSTSHGQEYTPPQVTLTTMILKPSWLHIQWWTNIENVRVLAILQVRNTQFAPVIKYNKV